MMLSNPKPCPNIARTLDRNQTIECQKIKTKANEKTNEVLTKW